MNQVTTTENQNYEVLRRKINKQPLLTHWAAHYDVRSKQLKSSKKP